MDEHKMPESETRNNNRFQVGYALPTRKLSTFMIPPFINHAKNHGIDFIKIDISKPLTNQNPPFDCIIHKINNHDWNHNLHNYTLSNPETVIIDPPSAVERLHNRLSMLEPITKLNITNLNIPNQVLVSDHTSLSSVIELKFPMIAKALVADGTTKSHKMSLVLNRQGLAKLDLDSPIVLQQFINHGGVIFKVYVAGDYVKCVRRQSIADISEMMLEKIASDSSGIMCFSQISNSAMVGGIDEDVMMMPAQEFVADVANGLRKSLGLHLFNFDMIKDDNGDGYLVIDINYFPGFEKLPSYETVMTDFLLSVLKSRK